MDNRDQDEVLEGNEVAGAKQLSKCLYEDIEKCFYYFPPHLCLQLNSPFNLTFN